MWKGAHIGAEAQAAAGLQQPASLQRLPPEHAPFISACFNKLNLLQICFIFLIKKLKPLLGLPVIERQLVMSSGVSSGLLETPAESPSASPFTTYLTMADPGLCLCVAPCFEHACACPLQKPGSDSQLLWRHEVHSNVAFSDSHCGSRPWQSHVPQLSTGSHAAAPAYHRSPQD